MALSDADVQKQVRKCVVKKHQYQTIECECSRSRDHIHINIIWSEAN